VLEDDLSNPAAAPGIVAGALATVSHGIGYIMAPNAVASDESWWVGSRDAWDQLDKGNFSDINNEFVDGAWPFITEGRWTADKAVSLLEGFDGEGRLTDRLLLVKAYTYAALVRVFIADMFDNFVFSDKTEAKPAIGETNMNSLYDQAISMLDKALAIAQSGTTAAHVEQQRRILGLRARAKHAKAVWGLLNPRPSGPIANPYVAAVDARTDALAALAVMTADYKWRFDYFTPLTFNELAWELVGRSEHNFGSPPRTETPKTGTAGTFIPDDPITGVADVRISAIIADFRNLAAYSDRYSPITLVSEREMNLIIAESFLASGDAAGARARLNTVRALNNLAPYPDTFSAGTALQHERRANLYLQGRRLNDMYRFGTTSVRWLTGNDALARPGTFFPITIREIRANPNL
ncbi:MAG: RagB/SusD family nutrient uptake outer membrane protein, partial [Bacteroidota bacterium]